MTLKQKDGAITRGNYASTQAISNFLREEMGDMHQKGIFLGLPYSLVKHLPQLWIFPLGCVP